MSTESCCQHGVDQHQIIGLCLAEIHYADEDAPCECTEVIAGAEGVRCATCDHPATEHRRARVCRGDQEMCGCAKQLG